MDIQQRVEWLNRHPDVQPILAHLDAMRDAILASAIHIQQIPAPTFDELARANDVLAQFGACGLDGTGLDSATNVFGYVRGKEPDLPALLVSAHTDTVFPHQTDLTVSQDNGERLYGPGIGDNSLGVAALLAVAGILRTFGIVPRRNIWFLANSREEGLGDLGGIKQFYADHGSKLGLAVVLEGLALGRVFHQGIAVRRLHVTFQGQGGHSWQHFGRASAIHHLLVTGAKLARLSVPEFPRTTYNIGIIEGGQSVNSIASDAGFYLDMRSEDATVLAQLEATVRDTILADVEPSSIEATITVVGDRPAGRLDREHELVRGAISALKSVGIQGTFETGSTDANLLLARGLPAVTLGVTSGANAHRLTEYIDIKPISKGMRQILLIVLAASGWEPA